MRAKTKTVFKGFDYMHCDDFARYLSEMSAKGWHFKEWGMGLKFEKGEPADVTYAVEIFTKASENDLRPEPHTQEFAEFCEAAGWKFIDGKQKFCIFKKVDDTAVELFTPEERVNNSVKGMFSAGNILTLVLYGINALLMWANLNMGFERNIFSGTFTFSFVVWNVLFIGQGIAFLFALWKKLNLKKAIREGRKIYIGNRLDGKYHIGWRDVFITFLVFMLMYYFYVLDQVQIIIINVGVIVLTVGFALILNKIRPEREMNILIQICYGIGFFFALIMAVFVTIAIGNDQEKEIEEAADLPIMVSDYREFTDTIDTVDYYHEYNFLGEMDVYYIWGEEEAVHYTVYTSKHDAILDRLWEELVGGKKLNEDAVDCTADWGALKAIRNRVGTYYVRYENMILEFSDNEDLYLSADQINIIREKLELK